MRYVSCKNGCILGVFREKICTSEVRVKEGRGGLIQVVAHDRVSASGARSSHAMHPDIYPVVYSSRSYGTQEDTC